MCTRNSVTTNIAIRTSSPTKQCTDFGSTSFGTHFYGYTHLPLFSLFKSVPKIVLSPILPSAHPLPKSCAQILHAPHTRNTFSIVRYEISVPGLSHPFPYPPYYKIVHHPSFCLAHFFLFLYKTMFLGSCTPSYTHRTTAKCTIPVSVLPCR